MACVELHTFSSLNKKFLPEYQNALAPAETGIVFYSEHTLKMKKLPPLSKEEIQKHFNHPNLEVFTKKEDLEDYLIRMDWNKQNLLLMSSGNFQGMDYEQFLERLLE